MKQTGTLLESMQKEGWIFRCVPSGWRPYIRLMRLDQPIGSWLLLFPGWWSLSLAADGRPDWRLAALFGLGAVVMRGAGCVYNDIVDRDIDRRVERTLNRPLVSGQTTTRRAAAFLLFLLCVGLLILLQLSPMAMALGTGSLALVFAYPYMKRITYWPQAWLGLTFNWGALMGWAAQTNDLALAPFALYAGGFFWTLGYDTIYAHQDREDDAVIGVKSTALRFGEATSKWLSGFYALAFCGFALAGGLAGLSFAFYGLITLVGLHFFWQIRTLDINDGENCKQRFRSNRFIGWLLLIAILAGQWR